MATLCHTEYAVQKRDQLEASLLNLMEQQPYQEITVTDICRGAGIPRRTFYHYFESKDSVLESIIDNLMQRCVLEVMDIYHLGIEHMEDSFYRIFCFWSGENRKKLDALIRSGQESRLTARAVGWVRRERFAFLQKSDLDPKLVEIGLMIGATDFYTLLFYWSRGGYQETPEQMAKYAMWVLPQAFYNL